MANMKENKKIDEVDEDEIVIDEDHDLSYHLSAYSRDFSGTIMVGFDTSLNAAALKELSQAYPKARTMVINLLRFPTGSELYTAEQTKALKEVAELLEGRGVSLKFLSGFSIEQAAALSGRLNQLAEAVNGERVGGQPLGPLDKFLKAYELAGEVASKPSSELALGESQSIICPDQPSLLAELCTRVGLPASRILATPRHAACVVRITDPAYGLDNDFFCDPQPEANSNRKDDVSLLYSIRSRRSASGCETEINSATELKSINLKSLKKKLDKIQLDELEKSSPEVFAEAKELTGQCFARLEYDYILDIIGEARMKEFGLSSGDFQKEMVAALCKDVELREALLKNVESKKALRALTKACPILESTFRQLSSEQEQATLSALLNQRSSD